MSSKMTIYLIHHSHTDIGYTDTQETIKDDQTEYIRQVLKILKCGQYPSFKWVCETLWVVEQFMQTASPKEAELFAYYVKEGKIGLSGSYLNMTEAICTEALTDIMKDSIEKAHAFGANPVCAITSDINGYSWGYADILSSLGIKNLYTQINSTHGHEPFKRRQMPFVWEGPNGGRVHVWIGEHYNQGNWLGLCPRTEKDIESCVETACTEIPKYIRNLKGTGYKFDFFPIGISGSLIDNAPPNPYISLLVSRWNEKHREQIEIKLSTLEQFFERANQETLDMYSGDWTDWWADGIASTPAALKIFREAQRKYIFCKRLKADNLKKAAYYLNLFAEHTWGYYASISDPFLSTVSLLDAKKEAYATIAHTEVSDVVNKLCKTYGKTTKSCCGSQRLFALNTNDTSDLYVLQYMDTSFDQCEYHSISDGICTYPLQIANRELVLVIPFSAKESKTLFLLREDKQDFIPILTCKGNMLFTDSIEVTIDESVGGIRLVKDRKTSTVIDCVYQNDTAFCPLYEVTTCKNTSQVDVRVGMSMQRRSRHTRLVKAKLAGFSVTENGPVRAKVLMDYRLPGASVCQIEIIFFKGIQGFDIRFILNKESVWEPESLYLPLPFAHNSDFYVDKTGCIIQPGVSQIPGSCQEFYSIQNGLVFTNPDTTISILAKDAPLIWCGSLTDLSEQVCKRNSKDNHRPVYSWVMNNFWETNFKASLGGFYSFEYSVRFSHDNIHNAFQKLKDSAIGIMLFPNKDGF